MTMSLPVGRVARAMWQYMSAHNIASSLFFLFFAAVAWLLLDDSQAHADTPSPEPANHWDVTSMTAELSSSTMTIAQPNGDWTATMPVQLLDPSALPIVSTSDVPLLRPVLAPTEQATPVASDTPPAATQPSAAVAPLTLEPAVAISETPRSEQSAHLAHPAPSLPTTELPASTPSPSGGIMASSWGHFFGAESVNVDCAFASCDRHSTSNALVSTRSLDVPGTPSFSPD